MSFYYSARKQVISIFSSDAAYSWNQLKINYIVQKNTKKAFHSTVPQWNDGGAAHRRPEQQIM